jgi:acyl dehydratase
MKQLEPSAVKPVTREQVAKFASAVGDFNPMHFDVEFARAAGLPNTVIHGPLTVALVLDAIARQIGPENILNLDTRLRAPVYPGDELKVVSTDYGVEVRNGAGALVATAVVLLRGDE